MKYLWVLVLLLAGCTATPHRRELALAPELDAAIGRAVAVLPSVPGLAVAVYSRDGVYVRAFGVTDVTTRAPATTDSAFYIASSTKPLTALAFAALARRGELDLDESIAAFAPEANFPQAVHPEKVTFRRLLTHTAGIVNDPIAFRVAYSGEHDPDLLWRLLAASRPNSEAPLGEFSYANVGYNIATVLTDRKLGISWRELLAREIFTPAGMTRTTAWASRARAARWSIAMPHQYSASLRGPERIYLEKADETLHSAGGVFMSAHDAERWLELMVEDGRIDGRQAVSAKAVQATRVPQADLDETRDGFTRKHYGLGWYIGAWRDEAMLQQHGAFAGARTHMSYLPERHTGIAVFVNDASVSAPVVDLIAKFVYDRLANRADARAEFASAVDRLATEGPARWAAAERERASRPWKLTLPRETYGGSYENAQLGTMVIEVTDGELKARIGRLHATASAFTEPDSMRVEFAPGQGEVMRFEVVGSGPSALVFEGSRFVRR